MSMTHENILSALSKACMEEQFEGMVCPRCGSRLDLSVHPDMSKFFVRCMKDTTHLAMHGENHNSPAWWSKHIGGGWY